MLFITISLITQANVTVTWTAIDAAGKSNICTQTVTISEGEAPEIKCPVDITVNADEGKCNAIIDDIGMATASDNCNVKWIGTNSTCNLPIHPGPDEGVFIRWAFNPTTCGCESFFYGGTVGNANNFETKVASEASVPNSN